MFRSVIACVVFGFGFPVWAQDSLGIAGATLELGSAEDEAGARRAGMASSVDVRITGVHGLQGDLSFTDTATGTLGRVGAHLYMAPAPGRKYGLFVSLSDMDGRSMTWASAGAEGMLELSGRTIVEGRLGLGAADGNALDFIFGSLSMAHAVTPAFEVEAALDLADFDEADFRATAVEATVTARYSPENTPWGVYASLGRSDLTGRDGRPAKTRIGFGVTIRFGNTGGVDADTRTFRRADPVAPLVRRGIR